MTAIEHDFSKKTAIVFAASRGIGRAVAVQLGRCRARVVVNYAQNRAKADEVVEAIDASGGSAVAVQADVSVAGDVQQVFDLAKTRFGDIDIVVNAAGVSAFGPLGTMSDDDVDRLIAVNVRGAFNVLSRAGGAVSDGGAIVQFSTGGTKMPVPGGGAYAGTKSAGELMALGLAKELGPRRVRVNVISPGVTDTDGLVMPADQIQMLIAQTPLGRLGKPEDVADAVVFLVSDQAGWITAQNLQANGGIL